MWRRCGGLWEDGQKIGIIDTNGLQRECTGSGGRGRGRRGGADDVGPAGIAGAVDSADAIEPGCAGGQAGVGNVGDGGADLSKIGEAADDARGAENFEPIFVDGVVLPGKLILAADAAARGSVATG